ncbi:MAG: ATP-binding protein [Nitrosopumilus sp.]|nr:ATP-binding protein [Nitrosopumilus sp.]MDH3735399.1 ATP-binding protein [Nitrosopumilus sp.]
MQNNWVEENQSYLSNQINYVKKLIKANILPKKNTLSNDEKSRPPLWNKDIDSSSPSLEFLSHLFGLSVFEKYVLVLCAGNELDSELKQLCIKNNSHNPYPNFELALSILPGAHWSALTPESPLRRLNLISLENTPNTTITTSQIRIDERILHYLTGINYLDPRLRGFVTPIKIEKHLIKSNHQLVKNIVDSFRHNKKLSVIQLLGSDTINKKIVGYDACEKLGLRMWKLLPQSIPGKVDEMESFMRLWNRDSALLGACLYIQADDLDSNHKEVLDKFLGGNLTGPIFLSTLEGWMGKNMEEVTSFNVPVKKPERSEQKTLWKQYLDEFHDDKNFDGTVNKITNQFDFDSYSIHLASNTVINSALDSETKTHLDENFLYTTVWESCRQISRPKMSGLAQRIVPKSTMNDLVLPEKEKKSLYDMIRHIKNKEKVYTTWGFENIASHGLGDVSLFAGESGTGKTMAAEVISNELNLDLFRIDLSMIISKYIGETEKNLRKIFDAAEDGGSILFFDEADALFGKRSEVHDSHDRYANIEVGYLLQRMESYHGLAILATNYKNAMDTAFLRRIRFVINFPFPDEKSREKIWKGSFPKLAPTNSVDFGKLSKLSVTGGNIRNIALNAAFLAAEDDIPINMSHLKQAAKSEYDKLEKPLTRIEVGDW